MLVDLYPEMGASVTASVSRCFDNCILEEFDEGEIHRFFAVQPGQVFSCCWGRRSYVSTRSDLPCLSFFLGSDTCRPTIAIL